ncbi:MAG: D-ribose ABC transporter substrate-binding protein [Trueperaceae bacterium]|jgi:ribose transport system substrate-binding protein|nr:D-ribose ABC transporter substrate-binding protein [Truepera sp.]HRN18222.1 D-ribose ABC transporter substrate-binding protein [Trueperaceae bacterium]HRQ10421.1 D-ribose ABC transporter substrate-binding protein [Trueperaceae bacterium]
MRRLLFIAIAALLGASFAQTIGLSLSTLNNPFFVQVRDGAQAAADELGLKLVVTDAQDSVSNQISNIEDLLQSGVSVLIINATDSDAVVPAVMEANTRNVPVIAVDRGINGGTVAYFIASDNVAGGALAGKFICDKLGGEGNVVELEGIAGTSAARERGQGFNDYLTSSCPGLKVVARQTANFNRAEGLDVMENILVAQPDIDAVFAHNDEMALGALQAVQASGRKILVVGFDATDDAVAAVQACTMAATVAQQPKLLGDEAVRAAKKIIDDGAPATTQNIAVSLQLVTNDACN